MKKVHIFLIGTGLIGGALLDMLPKNVRLVGLANTQGMLFDRKGIHPGNWKKLLETRGQKTDIARFLKNIISFKFPNSVLVDCTGGDDIARLYPQILSQGISIVTPNKKANSGSFKNYAAIRQAAKKSGAKFLYETNVGAGLPVIGPLQDLLAAGDEIVSIEGVFSGTLSFIFNTFDGSKPFSEVVRKAKELGYTEPDPRDDLSGVDVARKILILARETGTKLELKDVKITSLLSPACMKAKSVEDFFIALKGMDHHFKKLAETARRNHQALRFIARFAKGKASLSLESVSMDHPFYSLSGADNIISFRTKYYSQTPLVIRGPGAGAKVTAAGVLADILKVAC